MRAIILFLAAAACFGQAIDSRMDYNTQIKNKPSLSLTGAPFNAKGDGIIDDRAAFQKAFDATPIGTVLDIPAGTYRIVADPALGPDVLRLTRPISLSGSATLSFELPAVSTATVTACSEDSGGIVTITADNSFVAGWHGQFNSVFATACAFLNGAMFDVATANSTQFTFLFQGFIVAGGGADSGTAQASMGLLHVEPQCDNTYCAADWDTWKIEDLTINGPGSSINAMAGLVLSCLASPFSQFSKSTIRNVSFRGGLQGGYSLYMNNQVNHEGCWLISDLADNRWGNGIYLYNAGDTLHIHGGRITNAYGDGINLWSILGAVDNTIEHVNIITAGNPIHVRSVQQLTIATVEIGAHDYAGSPVPLMAPTANVWLDGKASRDSSGSVDTIDGVKLENNQFGTDELDTLAIPNLQIDLGVQNTYIGQNTWHPPIASMGPYACGVYNDGYNTVLENDPRILRLTQGGVSPIRFLCGSGSLGREDFLSLSGLGEVYENGLVWSEDLSQPSAWIIATTGTGTVTVTQQGGVTLPNGKVGTASRLQMNEGTGTAELVQGVGGLTNPHSNAVQGWIRNTTCADPPATLLFGGTDSIVVATSDCSGDAYGWRPLRSGRNSKVNATTDYALLLLTPNSLISTTADVLVTYMQWGSHFSRYVKTEDVPVPLSYGSNQARSVSRPESQFGYQDTSTTPPPLCNMLTLGLAYDDKSRGTDQPKRCELINASPAAYGWVSYFMLVPSTENWFLQSNTWNVSWTLAYGGGALAPVVTNAPLVDDPSGHTGTVQEVLFDLNGGTISTVTDSHVGQSVTKPVSGLTSTTGMWIKAKSGAPFVMYFGPGGPPPCGGAIVITSNWQYFSRVCTDGYGGLGVDSFTLGIQYELAPTYDPSTSYPIGTTVQYGSLYYLALTNSDSGHQPDISPTFWGLTVTYINPFPATADIYVSGACLTYYGGICTTLAGAPLITTTAALTTPVIAVTTGPFQSGSLAGSGSRVVVADPSGTLSAPVTPPAAGLPATPLFIAATTHAMTAPREYFLCSTATACSVTLPVPAAGYEFCVRSANNVSTTITLAGRTNIYYELPTRTGWGTVSAALVSTGAAVTNQVCVVGYDATHYAIMSSTGF